MRCRVCGNQLPLIGCVHVVWLCVSRYDIHSKSLGVKALELVALNTFLPAIISLATVLVGKVVSLVKAAVRPPGCGLEECGFLTATRGCFRKQLYPRIGWALPAAHAVRPQISMWYANLLKTIIMAFLFAPISPAVYPLSVISLLILYAEVRA